MASARVQLPPPTNETVDVLFIAGEHSGDQHAARLVRRLRELQPGLRIAALGGPELAAAGAQLLYDLTESSVVGLIEVLKNLSFFRQLHAQTLSWIREYKPRAVCFVDYPGFNLRIAQALHQQKLSRAGGGAIRTLYYISPQIWAWKSGRRFEMAKHLDGIAVIFPFEVKSYADTRLPAEFVGHPFVAEDHASLVQYDPDGPVLLLPGSRKQPVSRIFPSMLAGFQAFGERSGVVLYPSQEIETILRAAHPPSNVELRPTPRAGGASASADTRAGAPVRASAVLTSSGTMSMHCALAGIPGAIVYRAHPVTYFVGKRVVNVAQLGIANLLLGEPMYPEYIQGAARPEALAAELRACIHNPDRRRATEQKARQLRAILRQPTQGDAAEWLLRWLNAAG